PGDEHLPGWQERCHGVASKPAHAPRGGPPAGSGVVEFSRAAGHTPHHHAPCHEEPSVEQRGRREILKAGMPHTARARPAADPPARSTLPVGSSVAVCPWRAVCILPVAAHRPVDGSYSSALAQGTQSPLVALPPATRTWPEGKSVAV